MLKSALLFSSLDNLLTDLHFHGRPAISTIDNTQGFPFQRAYMACLYIEVCSYARAFLIIVGNHLCGKTTTRSFVGTELLLHKGLACDTLIDLPSYL